jgi:hypothetical protein
LVADQFWARILLSVVVVVPVIPNQQTLHGPAVEVLLNSMAATLQGELVLRQPQVEAIRVEMPKSLMRVAVVVLEALVSTMTMQHLVREVD